MLEELVEGVTDDTVVGGAVLLEDSVGVVAIELGQSAVQRADVEATTVLRQEVSNTVKDVLLTGAEAGHEEAVSNLNVSGSHEAVGSVKLGKELVRQGGGGKDEIQEVHDLLGAHGLEVIGGGSLSSVLQPLIGKSLASLTERVLEQGRRIPGGETRLVQPSVPIDGGNLLAGAGLEVLDELSLEGLSSDGLSFVLGVVSVDPLEHGGRASNLVLEEEQEEGSLLIRNLGEGIIGVNSLKVGAELGVLVLGTNIGDSPVEEKVAKGVRNEAEEKVKRKGKIVQSNSIWTANKGLWGNVLAEILVSNAHLEEAVLLSLENLTEDETLEVDAETFVEPEVVPVGVGDPVTGPRVSNLVSNDVGEGAITSEKGGGEEGELRVLHASKGESRRKDDNIVDTPSVRDLGKLLSSLDKVLSIGLELVDGAVEPFSLSPDG